MKNLQAFIIGLSAILLFGAITINAATWTITKVSNSSDNVCDADCSLREAVHQAGLNFGTDTVRKSSASPKKSKNEF